MSRSLRLYVPQLPVTLAEQFIRDRYRRILERKNWSALRAESEFLLDDLKDDGTVSVTRSSTSVVGTSTAFTATDVGRQFKTGSSSVYTITGVNTGTQTLTLDRAYGDPTDADATYKVFDGYVVAPTDFLEFIDIVDRNPGWKLRYNVSMAELNAADPQRVNFGQPYLLADYQFDTDTGLPRYEVWPYTSSARTLYFTYYKRAGDLVEDDDTPIWPIRSDAIVSGALADVARWPGTADQPNLYFSRPEMWKAYEAEYEDKMIELERRDEDIYTTWLQQYPYADFQYAPSAAWIQSHVIR